MIRLIIFDLDGTLVDSSVDLTNALNYATAPYGMGQLSVQETKNLVGEGITRLIERLLGAERSSIRQEVMDRFMEYYSAHLADFTRPYDGVPDVLAMLHRYDKAVISNKRESLSKRLLLDLGLLHFFGAVLGSDSVGEKKPSPKPVLRVMEMLSCNADQTVIVGDSNYDIEAGRAAGVGTIAVSYGYREVGLLQQADVIIGRFQDLPSALAHFGDRGNDA